MEEMHKLEAVYRAQTERGVLLEAGEREIWFPKSELNRVAPEAGTELQDGDAITVEVPHWLMADKELL